VGRYWGEKGSFYKKKKLKGVERGKPQGMKERGTTQQSESGDWRGKF